MSRSKRYIEIEGILARDVLGTFTIIRGFATLQELAEISAPHFMRGIPGTALVEGAQRPLDQQHAEEVKRYFEDGDRRFIPEVILSVRADRTDEMKDSQPVGVSVIVDGLTIKRKHTSRTIGIHTLKVDRKKLAALKAAGRLRRIDGNHRLELATSLRPAPGQPNKYRVPFCLMLLGEPANAADNYSEALVFHSINSTAKRLDVEHALKLILGQPAAETMPAAKEFAFNPALHLTRLLHEKFTGLHEPARGRLGSRPLSALSIAARELLQAYPAKKADLAALEAFANELVGALADLCARLDGSNADICATEYFVELAGHVWMQAPGTTHKAKLPHAQKRLEQLAGWLGHDGLRGLQSERPLGRQLLDIYAEVEKRKPKNLFLARWYPTPDKGEALQKAQFRLEQIKATLDDLKRNHDVRLNLIDMGTQSALVIPIHTEMYNAIKTSDIILCDLSGSRPNVCVEAGYALSHHQKGRLVFMFEPADNNDKVPFDLNTFRYLPIPQAAAIPALLKAAILEIMANAAQGAI
jgi:hypothetical protein